MSLTPSIRHIETVLMTGSVLQPYLTYYYYMWPRSEDQHTAATYDTFIIWQNKSSIQSRSDSAEMANGIEAFLECFDW